jgi:hypothetical protein
MRHFASPTFWQSYRKLPAHIRALADKNYSLLKDDPKHPALHFKKVGRFASALIIAPSVWKSTRDYYGFGSAHTLNTIS